MCVRLLWLFLPIHLRLKSLKLISIFAVNIRWAGTTSYRLLWHPYDDHHCNYHDHKSSQWSKNLPLLKSLLKWHKGTGTGPMRWTFLTSRKFIMWPLSILLTSVPKFVTYCMLALSYCLSGCTRRVDWISVLKPKHVSGPMPMSVGQGFQRTGDKGIAGGTTGSTGTDLLKRGRWVHPFGVLPKKKGKEK